MAETLTQLTGSFNLPNGETPRNGRFRLRFSGWSKDGSDIFVPGPVEGILNASGQLSNFFAQSTTVLDAYVLAYGSVKYWSDAAGQMVTVDFPGVAIPASGPVSYASLLAIPAPDPTVPDALAQALAAAAAADADAAAAAGSATAAAASSTNAALYSPAYFKDLAALVANTTVWPVGTLLNTRVEGATYEVLASGATDHNLTKGGGQKLRVHPGQLGYSSKAFGQPGPERIVYPATEATRYVKAAFADASGHWWTPIKVRTTGAIEFWELWAQSEGRGVTNSPAAIGGERQARDNVLCYVRGTTIAGVPDGWYAVGPEDDAWPFASSLNAVGSPIYQAAADRAEAIGGVVCIVMYAIGGAESGLFLQGGSMWAGLQASHSDAIAAALPGRGMSLTGMGKTLADRFFVWQGSADADYKLGTGDAAASGDDWAVRWRTIFNSLISPSGMSVPIIEAGRTQIIMFEMLHGATGGGAPGVGNPTDSRNRDLHKFLLVSSSRRNQITIVGMAGVNNYTSNPEVIGSPDNLHPNGAAYNEINRRVTAAIAAFDPADRNDAWIENSAGYTICYPNGTFESWSKDLVTTNNVVVAVGTGGYRTSNVTWTIPFPAGYAASEPPNVTPCQCKTAVASTFPGARVSQATVTTATAYAVSDEAIAGVATLRLMARGLWVKT